jgi:hypothetical protein
MAPTTCRRHAERDPVTGDWRRHTLAELLGPFDLDLLPEHEFPNDGWSGATFTSLVDGYGRRFVLKRTSLATDWIARATLDRDLREGWCAEVSAAWLPRAVMPYLGAAADPDGADRVVILTPDLSNELIAWERPGHDPVIDAPTLERVLTAVARLHSLPTASLTRTSDGAELDPPWCPIAERLTLLTPPSAAAYAADGNPVGDRFLAGWDAFRRRAGSDALDLIDRLASDPTPLVDALARAPAVALHGDLKLANVALLPGGQVAFIDWQMLMHAPIAVELGWFLVANSASLADRPTEVMAAYRRALEWNRWGYLEPGHDGTSVTGDWETTLDLTWIVGLLLRGWRKGLDADAGVTLPSGLTAADDLGWWAGQATQAAERRL